MYQLMVSRNAGETYRLYTNARTLEKLCSAYEHLDSKRLRWYVLDPDGNKMSHPVCQIHLGILARASKLLVGIGKVRK